MVYLVQRRRAFPKPITNQLHGQIKAYVYGQRNVQALLPHDDAGQGEEDCTKIKVVQIAFGNQKHTPHACYRCQGTDEGSILNDGYGNAGDWKGHAVYFFECRAFLPKSGDFIQKSHYWAFIVLFKSAKKCPFKSEINRLFCCKIKNQTELLLGIFYYFIKKLSLKGISSLLKWKCFQYLKPVLYWFYMSYYHV